MISKVEYTFHVDKAGRKYALKVDVKSGKKSRIVYKVAQKRARDLKYRRKQAAVKADVIERIHKEGSTASYREYQHNVVEIEKQLIASRKKNKKPPLSKAQSKARAKKITIEDRSGIATRLRYAWVYRVVVERYRDQDTQEIVVECDTSIFRARAVKRNGNEFTKMCGLVQGVYDKIQSLDLCSLDGGACVVLYDKFDREVIKQFELGKGCGFSFDFKNYDHEEDEDAGDYMEI